MFFYADLHIHSKYSRATSKSCDLRQLASWAQKKGLSVISTGDFTHPAWFNEIKENLVPAGQGAFRLKYGGGNVRFLLSVEISTIYKKGDKTRKVHHVVFAPDFEAAEKFRNRLGRIGNISSDGRPILGLDSRDLLEIALESGDGCFIIPAHIWTPWFSALGSKSGFDSIQECYGDMAQHIFAVETGLSSDPEMNWRVSSLDKYRLVSNSDAHSPSKLAREATVFNTQPDYFSILKALKSGDGYVGTVEFFPEEGKYHEDGHRKCDVCLTPEETTGLGGICPVCGKPLTIGVLNRVNELADRKGNIIAPPTTAGQVFSLIPLQEILSEIMQTGAASKSVTAAYEGLMQKLGTELDILRVIPPEDISKACCPLLAEGISRLRRGQVIRQAGFDGEYGVIRLFDPCELESKKYGLPLMGIAGKKAGRKPGRANPPRFDNHPPRPEIQKKPASGLDKYQQDAVKNPARQLLIVAGPGSGKTTVLTSRISDIVSQGIIRSENCLAITFTRRAAEEMRGRLECDANIHTFHSLCLSILKENCETAGLAPDFQIDDKVTFDDLVSLAVRLLDENPDIAKSYRQRFKYISVDEYQDIDENQYKLIRLLASGDGFLCAIGDPNQAIYGFRGGDSKFFKSFAQDYPESVTINLKNNYRSTGTIVQASNQMIESSGITAVFDSPHDKITIHTAPTDKAEAEFVVKTIENLIGGHTFYSIDTGRSGGEDNNLSFGDFAVLYRTSSQLPPLMQAFARSGMPFARLSGNLLCDNKDVKKLLKQLTGKQPIASQLDKFDGEQHIRQYMIDLAQKHPGKDEFISELALLSEIDTLDQKADRISLMSLHASKGLEFKCVFIVGLEDGLLPFYRTEDIGEERRLLYVGMTRAKQRLYLTRAVKRKQHGAWETRNISPFLENIEQQLLDLSKFEKAFHQKDIVKQLSLFDA